MSEEIEYAVQSELVNQRVLVNDEKSREELARKGYGEWEGKQYFLQLYETLYLLNLNKITVKNKNNTMDFDKLVDVSLKQDQEAWTRFLVYRDLRSRGYVAKEGFGFGVDFRVYERGEHGNKSAKYVVFGINEGTEMPVDKLNDAIEQIGRMGKEAVIAVIERRGEVIYYKVSKMRFMNNKNSFDFASISKK
ncbi:MAG: tRNA-intron endonuclease [Candidatus Nitrosomirales archaeon]